MPLFLPLLLAAPADAAAAKLQPAAEPSIVAAGKACVGVTADPDGQATRLTGWRPATTAEAKGVNSDGAIVMRDNIQLIYRTGSEGGCVVMANPDAAFDTAAFYADLGAAIGVPIATDPKNPVTKLPNGEVLVTVVTLEKDKRLVTLVVGNPNSEYAKKKGK
ncbi:hypothetical protein FPZ24_14195 [Sphingomonas panacisoli]|uniref:Uncharacterized protein n=1 Tax=Sphingomonas panacisoli TaxID=1813879 RepID=A0A5B8LKN4_9SPHN|nr:hypothetical protein [Sphingomonas panacisoli]QDZ08479.1 hypothetical protein FPZ24_14195 [Sphingomonas panacisoli]